MIRFLVKLFYFSTLLLMVLAGTLVFFVSTTPGLHLLINLSRLYIPGSLKIQELKGSLLNDFTIGTLEYQNKATTIKVKRLNIQWVPDASFKSHQLTAHWQDLQGLLSPTQQINSPDGTMTAKATWPNFNVDLNSKLNIVANENWQLKAQAHGVLPWQWTVDANLTQPQNASTGLHGNLSARGVIKNKNEGNMVLTVHPGFYQIPEGQAIAFKGGTINLLLSPKQLTGKGALAIDLNKNLKLDFQLPKFALDTGFKNKQALIGELLLDVNSLDFLQNLNPEIKNLKGQITASLKAKGTLGKPQIESSLLLNKTSLSLPKIGLDLDNIEFNALGKEKIWEATGTITSAGHNLALKGNANLNAELVGDLTLEGKDFPLIKTTEYQINTSPQLKLHVTPTIRQLTGSILIPNAQIRLQTFTNSLTLPDDIVYKRKEENVPPIALNSSMDITIEMGDNVNINVKGLKGFLDGTLHLKQQPLGPVNAYGELSVRDGTYKAYGQDLAIKQGELIFTGGSINNPGINLRAAKKINNSQPTITNANQLLDFNASNLQSVSYGDTITLGVEVTGRLTNPKIQLFSNPAILSQADILSMLVLGRPANQANKAGGQLLLTAISSMNIGGTNSTQLLEQLKQSSGLDFNVQTNTNYNQTTNTVSDSTAFVVGRALSKRLYLSYNIGLSQTDTNMLTLKYMLNKFFSIQISNSDTSSAIDFLYTSNKKKIKNHKLLHHPKPAG